MTQQAQAVVQTQQATPATSSIKGGILQRKCACGQHTVSGGECEECRKKSGGILQRAAVSPSSVNSVPPIVHDVLSSSGQPLDAGTRAFMEPRFGHDFSGVQVHTDTPKVIQTKLTINEPGDLYEQEADSVSDAVMRMSNPTINGSIGIGGKEGKFLQAKGIPSHSPDIPPDMQSYVDTMRGGGQPLPESVRAFFEPRFGYDFSQVRIHTDQQASESAQEVNALAYTTGYDIVFDVGQFSPSSSAGQKLLAHELTHVVQQDASGVSGIQRTFRLSELLPPAGTAKRPTNPIAPDPDTFFYPGSTRNTSGRRALIVAGIHGTEVSARELGLEINRQLMTGAAHTDFHVIVIPRANPGNTRGAGTGATAVPDLNREFATGYNSPNPYASRIVTIVNEFDPERIVSIHAIGDVSLAGVFLDPIHKGAYPPIKTEVEKQSAFTGDVRNVEAMSLTESMIGAVGKSTTPGNRPRPDFPASQYPSKGVSSSSLIYPLQGSVERSLGTWLSGLGKPIITIEIPGDRAPSSVWQTFLPAVWRFLEIQAPASKPTSAPSITPNPGTVPVQRSTRSIPEQISRTPKTQIQRETKQITSADLRPNPNRDLDRFMRHVYDLQVQLWVAQGASYVAGVPQAQLVTMPSQDVLPPRQIQLHHDVAEKVQSLLAQARQDLSAARAAGEANAQSVTDIRLRSGYRSALEQLTVWQKVDNYPKYYRATQAHRRTLLGGEHGEEAARYLAGYINERVFSPGYSPHQRGQTIDFTYYLNGVWAEADSSAAGISSWERSWLFGWLQRHALSYGFVQNPNIHEPWHWEYNQTLGLMLDFFRWLGSVLLMVLRSLRPLFFGGTGEVPREERVSPPSEPTER